MTSSEPLWERGTDIWVMSSDVDAFDVVRVSVRALIPSDFVSRSVGFSVLEVVSENWLLGRRKRVSGNMKTIIMRLH